MMLLAAASLLLADFQMGQYEMAGTAKDISYLGWHGAPTSTEQSTALTKLLSQAARTAGHRLRSVARTQPAVDDLVQQQALELEVLLGLAGRAAERAQSPAAPSWSTQPVVAKPSAQLSLILRGGGRL